MRFAGLHLKAFGPFTDRVLDLSAGGGDLHLIHGPNEAGKSSTLRAVSALLFGFPAQTGDDFLHKYSELRVGARLQLADGAGLALMRRKGRKNTLFAFDEASGDEITDAPLAEDVLDKLLGGLDEALYRTLFGLDLEGLKQGSEALTQGRGEVGRSLFQAAAGLASLRTLMGELQDHADATYKARGTSLPLNRALLEYETQRRLLRDSTVRSSAWESAERELRRAEETLAARRAALAAARSGQQRLERLRVNLPLLAERELARLELASLSDAVLLPADFRERRIAAEVELRGAEQARGEANARLAALAAEAGALVVRDALLVESVAIEQAYHAIAAFRAARETQPRSLERREALATRLAMLVADMGLGTTLAAAGVRLPSETLRARVLELIEQEARLAERRQHFDNELPTREARLKQLSARLDELPAPAPQDSLERTLTRIANFDDVEQRCSALVRDERALEALSHDELATLWSGTLTELLATGVPLSTTASDYEAEFATLAQDERLLADQETTLARHLLERERELGGLAASGELVTQTDVVAARESRDGQWQGVRDAWLQGTAGAAADMLPAQRADQFETALREADRRADLLHADVERATRATDLRQRIAEMQAERARQTESRAQLAARRSELDGRWRALLAPLRQTHLTPAALREWLALHARVMQRHAELLKLRQTREALEAEALRMRELLNGVLAECALPRMAAHERAGDALERAQQAVARARRVGNERAALAEQVASRRAELAELVQQSARLSELHAAWQLTWQDATAQLGLSGQALAAEARTRLEQFARLAAGLDEMRELESQANAHGQVVVSFESTLAALALTVEETNATLGADIVAERLYAALGVARAAQARAQQLAGEMAREREIAADAARAVARTGVTLDELRAMAGGVEVDALPALEDRAVRRRELEARFADIDTQLVRHNARTVEAVLAEADGQTLDGVESELAAVSDVLAAMEREIDADQETVFAARRALALIDGGAAAADAQQGLRSWSARIAAEARAYARLRLAHGVLERVVQRYRERHQGPLLARAATIFRRITLGSFTDLSVDYEADHQVLLGIRATGQRVAIGGMSQGTCDQLYLALRLAAIEQHIAGRGPFPVIVDDLLVQFDDARALATLEVLAELATRTQVLFFTHHQHLVSLVADKPIAQAMHIQAL